MYQALHNMAPSHLSEIFVFYFPSRVLHSQGILSKMSQFLFENLWIQVTRGIWSKPLEQYSTGVKAMTVFGWDFKSNLKT